MRHVIVTRVVVAFAVLLSAAVVVFTRAVTRPATPDTPVPAVQARPTGAELFAHHCAMCHQATATGIDYREAADRDAASVDLSAFLVDHHGPSPEAIALIVDHLMSGDGR